ncbi:unnamed protein product [Blepharisma stoltei]|uniref:Uncharacterized protein n=1 Tax=Blepharisma stoltei TaxID=1481888 RepID=A0AAU9J3I5_9CILI|nr:unnamed protein product [Blepharisma stoltei]
MIFYQFMQKFSMFIYSIIYLKIYIVSNLINCCFERNFYDYTRKKHFYRFLENSKLFSAIIFRDYWEALLDYKLLVIL